MLIVDAHLDLAMNAIEWNRDLTRPIDEIRAREHGHTDRPDRGKGTVSFAEMRRGKVGLCVATQIARYSTREHPFPGWHSPEQAWAMTQAQLAWYRAMEERGELVQVKDAAGLDQHLARVRRRGRWPDRLHPQPRGRRFARDHRPPRTRLWVRAASRRPRPLRAGRLRPGHQRAGRPRRARPRAACARWIGSA